MQGALDRLTLTAHSLRSPLAFLTPVQASCNYVTLFLRNIASTLAENLVTGTALRFNLVTIDDVQGAESVPSQKPFTTPDTSTADEHGPHPRQPIPEHRLARADARVRRRQRAILRNQRTDRQPARQCRAEDTDDDESRKG